MIDAQDEIVPSISKAVERLCSDAKPKRKYYKRTEYTKAYYRKNAERIKAYTRAYYRQNAERIKAYQRNKYQNDPAVRERMKRTAKEYYRRKRNREKEKDVTD